MLTVDEFNRYLELAADSILQEQNVIGGGSAQVWIDIEAAHVQGEAVFVDELTSERITNLYMDLFAKIREIHDALMDAIIHGD